jgi:arsenite transporter
MSRGAGIGLRSESKPLILIAASATGLAVNQRWPGALTNYDWLVRIGLFLVVYSIVAFVRIGRLDPRHLPPKLTALAITTNFVLVPAFAWLLGWVVLRNHPDLWAGVILYTLTPCIGWYLIFIDLAEGNIEWGLGMLPIDVILQTLLLPVYLWLFIGNIITVDITQLLTSTATFLLAPLALATLVRAVLERRLPKLTDHYKRLVERSKLWSLALVLVAIFATQPKLATGDLPAIALITIAITVFFLGIFIIALIVARTAKLSYRDTAALVFETTARNSESVIGIAATAYPGRPLVLLAIIIGPALELPVLLALTKVLLRIKPRWTHGPSHGVRRNATAAAPDG